MTQAEFDAQVEALCPRCAAGEPVRWREDTRETVHDWSFGGINPKIGRSPGMGHGICLAHAFRTEWEGKIDG